MANNNADIELLASLGLDSSEKEILKAIKILQSRIQANGNAKIKLNTQIDDTVIKEALSKLQNILKNKELNIDTQKSIIGIQKEADAMLEVVSSANRAAREKLEFANANKKVKESASNTADAINRERNAMESLDDVDYILNNLNMHARTGDSVFQQFGDTLRQAFSTYTIAHLLTQAIYRVTDAGKEALETVKELNDAATSIRMATGGSIDDANKLISSYNELGQEIGAITIDVAESADAWLRQGHSVADTNTLIKDSMMLSKISNLDAADSTEYLTSAMKGYKVAVEDVIEIVGKLASVDLVSATDAGGLAEAMSRTAETANLAGVPMDKLVGYLAAVGEVVGSDKMSSIGESFKTIFTRMADIKSGKLELIDEDGTTETLSDVETVLDNLGIKLRESNNEFRNFGDVLDEVAAGWDNYSSVQQAAVSKAFAGTRQGEKFKVLIKRRMNRRSW